jgi:hypothetical protein
MQNDPVVPDTGCTARAWCGEKSLDGTARCEPFLAILSHARNLLCVGYRFNMQEFPNWCFGTRPAGKMKICSEDEIWLTRVCFRGQVDELKGE